MVRAMSSKGVSVSVSDSLCMFRQSLPLFTEQPVIAYRGPLCPDRS
jgi:hypothetical protein